ncbi:hypothetical protein ARMSODRAFT_217730 [Armillaria solidipes]|uniref:Uncharacterized protein n=1 Tax=Armillaria solidipes TaxID=1076256 RepID=A0A2H3BZF4_9AGAR|nr:hypothetical protein ARMSODRAFT_217730 [Armillaria solidipes]
MSYVVLVTIPSFAAAFGYLILRGCRPGSGMATFPFLLIDYINIVLDVCTTYKNTRRTRKQCHDSGFSSSKGDTQIERK